MRISDWSSDACSSDLRSPTDEVIESALRYRAQAPLIDEMMKEIGVEGSNVARMGDIFRSARDAQSLAKEAEAKKSKRSEERSVGKGCVSTCRSRCSPVH